MAKDDEEYKQAIAKLLSDHGEQGVPDDTDIWPAVSRKLAERGTGDNRIQAENRREWLHSLQKTLFGHEPASAIYRQGPNIGRFARSALGIVGLVAILGLAVVAIASLAKQREMNTTKPPTQNDQQSADNTYLFSIQKGDVITTSYESGFGVGDDGSFWIGVGGDHIAHYSQSGKLLATLDLSNTIKYDTDLEVQGSMLWIRSGPTIYEASKDGSILTSYEPIMSMPITNAIDPRASMELILRVDGGGKMLVEKPDGTYLKVANQALGPDGKLSPPPLPGYPAGGKYYTRGRTPDEIMAGDVPVTIDVTATTGLTDGEPLAWHMLDVMQNGSFYVEVEPRTPQSGEPSPFIYVLHYSADGKLIERARVSSPGEFTVNEKQVAMGPNGEFYAVGLTRLESKGPYLHGRVDVVRLNFYPASQPLPPVPTPIPTPILPTPIPTIESQALLPVPTGPEPTFATWTPEPTATPQPTPIADLATLATKAEVIAHVQLQSMEPWNSEVLPFGAKILEWIKRPSDLVANNLNVDEFLGPNGEIKIAPALHEIPDMGEGEFIVFLNNDSIRWGNLQNFDFTDPISGVYRISNGKIDYAGIPTYKGWTVDQFKAALRPLVSTPEPVTQPVQDLVDLGRQSTIVEVQLDPSAWQQGETVPDGRVLLTAKVVNWLRTARPPDQEFVGLVVTPEESARLQSGSGHYFLFVSSYSSANDCEGFRFSGYYQISGQPSGIFEIRDNMIGYAGIQGLEGWDTTKFMATLSKYVPALQTDARNNGPVDVAGDTSNALVIAEVEIGTSQKIGVPTMMPDGSYSPGNPEPVIFTVRKWLKKPSDFTGDTIKVAIDSNDACRMSGKSDYYVIFLFQKTPFPKGSPLEGAYEPFGGYDGVYGVSNASIVFGGIGKYWGWPIGRFESEIKGLIQRGPSPAPTIATK